MGSVPICHGNLPISADCWEYVLLFCGLFVSLQKININKVRVRVHTNIFEI